MARKRKTRTHAPIAPSTGPKSIIIKHGQVGHSLSQLVRDLRKVMEPGTASRLRERNRNKLKDYLTIAPTLGVTHLLALTLSPLSPSLRLVRLSAGPTLSFRIERYALIKDILSSSRHPKSLTPASLLSPPLLVLSSFPTDNRPHLNLVMKAFQSLFPPLNPSTLSLSAAKRVVLVKYDEENDRIELRHFIVGVRPVGVSRRLRKTLEGSVGLGEQNDIADLLLGEGYMSDASSDHEDAEVKGGNRRAVSLNEVGPRLSLRLLKITASIPGQEGEVIYHSIVKKSKKEKEELKKRKTDKDAERKRRREEQEENVRKKKGVSFEDAGDDDDEEEDGDDWNDDDEVEQSDEDSEEEEPPPSKRRR